MAKAMSEWDKKLEAYKARRFQQKLPKTELGLWKLLEKKGFFTTTNGSKAGDYRPWSPTAAQWKWFEWVLEQQGHFMFMGARGIGKTELLLIFHCVYLLVQNPKYRILIITSTRDYGKFLLMKIFDMIEALGIPLSSKNKTYIKTADNRSVSPNIFYHSINSKIRSEAMDLIIIDDPLNEKEGSSQAKRNLVSIQIRECLAMCPRVFMMGTYTHEKDIFNEYDGKIPKKTAWRNDCPDLVKMTEEKFCNGNKSFRRSYFMNYEGIILPESEVFSKA